MAPSEQPTALALEALLRDGTLAGSWTLDAARSQVLLHTRHTWGLLPLQGVFHQVAGNGTVTAAGEVTGVITVAATSVDTKNPRRDKHLRTSDFFDVAAFPDFTFTAESASAADGGVRIAGSLTVRDRTQPVAFDAKVTVGDGEVTLDGEIPVNRADYGITWNFIGIAALNSTIAVHAVFTRQ